MSKVLKMTFLMEGKKTLTYSLADPKDGLTKAEVQTALDEMVEKKAITVGGAAITGVKEFYILSSERSELA